jgi:nucleotide-binding universal stress UspA family protein
MWGSKLVVLHVLDHPHDRELELDCGNPCYPIDPRDLAWENLLCDIGPLFSEATLLLAEGDPAEAIVRTAAEEGCDLIVLGIARDAPLRRFLSDRTADRVLRRTDRPVLIVKDRARGYYRNIVVAADFSEQSRVALEAAAGIFPNRVLTLLHAYDEGLLSAPAVRRMALQRLRDLVGEARLAAHRHAPRIVAERGEPAMLLRDYALARRVDLMVLGVHRQPRMMELVVGSTAKTIIDEAPCDLLVLPEPARLG